ncbi:unnamed protein product [Closterium sp. NIES-65]|nr:unnamed protein product [Closterium sp. NIES-65]
MIATAENHRQITKPIVGLRRVLGASPLAEGGGYRRGVGAERGRDWRNPRAGCRLGERGGKVRLAEVGDRSPFCLAEVGESGPSRRAEMGGNAPLPPSADGGIGEAAGESDAREILRACGKEMGLPEGMWYRGVPCTPVSTIKCGTDGNAIGM